MSRRLLLLLGLATVLSACGSSGKPGSRPASTATTPTTPTAPTTTGAATGTTAATRTVGTFFFRRGALTRVPVQISQTPAVAAAALNALLAGPPAGSKTAIPSGTMLSAVSIVDGTATASFSSGLGRPTHSAQGQIVRTLTQFPTVRRVVIVVAGHGQVPLQDGAGATLSNGATAADYVDLTAAALIFVRTPERDSTVSSPVRAAGTADTFEATFQVDIRLGKKLLRTQTITATSGSGTRGTWAAKLTLPHGNVTLVFYEASAEDGSHLHTTQVPLHVR